MFGEALYGSAHRIAAPRRAGVHANQTRGERVVSIDTTLLRMFDTLPAVPLAAAPRGNVFAIDPFGKETAGGFARGADLLLVGTFVGRNHAMALVQSGPGVDGFVQGQKIGDERLERIAPRTIELAGDDGVARTLAFADLAESGEIGRVPAFAYPAYPVRDDSVSKRPVKGGIAHRAPAKNASDADAPDDKPPKKSLATKRKSAIAAAGDIPHHSIFSDTRKVDSRSAGKSSRKGDRS